MGQELKGRTGDEVEVSKYTQKLRNIYNRVTNKDKATDRAQDAHYIRYIRVNTSAKSTEDCVKQLISEEFEKIDKVTSADAGKKVFCVDPLVPDLLVFPPDLNMANHILYHSKVFRKSEKASGFPVMALNLQKGWHVIDACAAPGGKTVHMANVMENEGKIFAFEKDRNRTEKLTKNVEQYGASCVEVANRNFLTVNPKDQRYSQVRAILVDPSCSGSGTIFMQCDKMSLEKYAELQLSLVLHALSFPSVQVVVYSTCSINEEENEDVVKKVLAKEGTRWQLTKAVPEWHRRGLPVMEGADNLLRTQYESDDTMGFFVAKFERISPDMVKMECSLDAKNSASDNATEITNSPSNNTNIDTKNTNTTIQNTTNTTNTTNTVNTTNTTSTINPANSTSTINTANTTNTNTGKNNTTETQTETSKKTIEPATKTPEISTKTSAPSTPELSHKTSPPSASEPSTSEPEPDISPDSPYMAHTPDLEYHSDESATDSPNQHTKTGETEPDEHRTSKRLKKG